MTGKYRTDVDGELSTAYMIRIPVDLLKRIRQLEEPMDRSLSSIVRCALREFVDRQEAQMPATRSRSKARRPRKEVR